jgi:uncharacterized protein YdaU (DUF1376 family)
MSATLSWMPLYVRDYDEDTGHLTCEQDGAYGRLLRKMWLRGDLPNDDAALARICGVTRTHWVRHIKPALMPLMTMTDIGTISQKRLQKERKNAAKISEKRTEVAKKRWQNQSVDSYDINDLADAKAYATDRTNQERLLVHPQPQCTIEKEDSTPDLFGSDEKKSAVRKASDEAPESPTAKVVHLNAGVTDDFAEFWMEYPKERHFEKRAALAEYAKARRKGVSHAVIIAGVRAMKQTTQPKFTLYPHRWLNRARWEDEALTVADHVLADTGTAPMPLYNGGRL